MRVALVDERRVNLIGEYTHVVLGGQIGQSQHFLARQYLADRVVRVAQHEGMAAVRERLLNGVEIEQPFIIAPAALAGARAQHRNLKDFHAIQTRHAQERHIGRSRYHDGVAGAHDLAQEHFERLQHVRHRADARRIHIPAVAALPCGARAGDLLLPRVGNVAERATFSSLFDGFGHARCQTVIHLGDECADAAGVTGPFIRTDLLQILDGRHVDVIGIKARGAGGCVAQSR